MMQVIEELSLKLSLKELDQVTYQMSFEVFDAATNGKTGLDSNDGNDVLDDPTATLDSGSLFW